MAATEYLGIAIEDDKGNINRLPYPTAASSPIFSWEVPPGKVQKAFCLELKTRFPTTLSDGTTGYAYYNSSIIESETPKHQVSFSMFQNVWAGIIEVRIRLYNGQGEVIYSTHETTEVVYPFEPTPQGYRWDSTYDGYYYVLDTVVEQVTGTVNPIFQWRNVTDEDVGQTISYQLQWSLTPLFLEGVYGQLGVSNTKTLPAVETPGLYSTLQTIVDKKDPLFFRVRAYDGLDYGEWSKVNGFYSTPSSAPYCIFNWVETNCTSTYPNVLLRPNGEVEISFRVIDIDTPIVSAYLTYKLDGIEYPCSLDSSTVSIPSNQDIQVTWLSARQLPNKNVIVYIYLYAYDGVSESNKVIWQYPLVINNTGIGFGYNDGTDDVMSYRFVGWLRNYERWIQIPEEKTAVEIVEGKVVYKPIPIPEGAEEGSRFDWATYWSNKIGSDIVLYSYFPGDNIAWAYRGLLKRSNWNIYNGYDGAGRDEEDKLYLEYEDEFYERPRDPGEQFIPYFGNNYGYRLGRGIPNIVYFLVPPQFGVRLDIRRPTVVKAGTLGLYFDGAGLNNTASDYFGTGTDQDAGIYELTRKKIWGNFYQLDPMFYPGVVNNYTFLGLYDAKRWDSTNQWYWTLFEYKVTLILPFSIERDVNDRFMYRFNGITFEGSILPEGEDIVYFNWFSTIPNKLLMMLKKLFPNNIFQDITNIDNSNNKYTFTVYSLWKDINKTFQFVETPNSCYRSMSVDTKLRFSQKSKSSGTSDSFVVYKPYSDFKTPAIYEVNIDTGDCLGEEGEINNSEPLFTCDPIHLNKYGCHYKYTRNRYLAAGKKVFIRKYSIKPVYTYSSSEPLRDKLDSSDTVPAIGFRNYRLKYVGKNSLGEDIFIKEFLPDRIGGVPAKSKTIPVIFETKELEEQGWWTPTGDMNNPKACISHDWNDAKNAYYRKWPQSYAPQIGFQDCYQTEYVELNEGWEKPFYDVEQALSRIDQRQPIIQKAEIPQGYMQYVQGAYRPPQDQTVEISSFDANYSSVVIESEAVGWLRYDRYKTYWDDSNSPRISEKLGIVVDPIFSEPRGIERGIEKWGYMPDQSLEVYFKEDTTGIWKDRVIPFKNSYVHAIYKDNDISWPICSRIHMYRVIISDTSKVVMPEDEGVKEPYLDYRIRGGSPWEMKYYYSALPQDESPYYLTRPPAIYGEDRPTRISGFIDAMSIVVPWKVLYLQTEWNSYNLIHWEGSQDNSVYAKLEVARIDDNGISGAFMSLRTKNAEWFSNYSAWLIPFVKLKQSDYIDTLNGSFSTMVNGKRVDYQFEEEKRYRFRLSGLNINSGSANTPVLSSIFTYSKMAYSPPIILNVEYNKWTQEFTIEFRFDDVRGRKYDIVNFFYATYEPNQPSPVDSAFIQLGIEPLQGQLIDLDSNITGDNVVSEAYLIKHKVFFSSDILFDTEGKNIRFRLECIASEDREGLTAPVFYFLMWGNEFLKKADDQINSIVGSKNRWVYNVDIDDKGNPTEEWVYLSEEDAIIVQGFLSEQNEIISGINQKFEDWYYTVAKFIEPSFDAKYNYLCVYDRDGELYTACFDAFISELGLSSEWTEYQAQYPGRAKSFLEPLFISEKGYTEEFSFFWDNKSNGLIGNLDGFSEWFEDNKSLSREEAKPMFLAQTQYAEDYQKYLEDNQLVDDDDSRTDFIVNNNYQGAFEQYYIRLNNYPDSRYEERKKFVSDNYSAEFESWKAAPIDAYGAVIPASEIGLDDDALRQFIASNKAIWDSMSYVNAGKQEANNYYLSVYENGVTYGQQLQTAASKINNYQNTLNSAYYVRNHYETLHRRNLIKKGYFSNGWKNNQAYVYENKNEIFRFRVENQPISGKRTNDAEALEFDGTWPTISSPIAGYDTLWDIYFHFQMDFYDSFDSQNGKPLRDYLWQRLDCSGYVGSEVDSRDIDGVSYIRILGGIEADVGGMHVLPENTYTPDSGEYGKSPTTADPYSFQFAGRFSIMKTELPGELETDVLPPDWNTGQPSSSDDFNQLYFWRVCPYNIVQRPIFERELAKTDSYSFFARGGRTHNSFWKVIVYNNFKGNFKYSLMPGSGSYFVWASYNKLEEPIWKTDFNSTCWNNNEAFYENFFHGTNAQRQDIEYQSNTVRSAYRERISNGEVVFLTDRPREIEEGNLNYIEDSNDHFRSLWIPFNTDRSKPWMFFDEDEKCWFIISQKPSKNRVGYTEYIFTLSRGLSPQTFGEECQLFPFSSMDSVNSVIEGAQSFENPCILKRNGLYEIFFNIRKDGGVYESYRAESKNLYDWVNFKKIIFSTNSAFLDMSVYWDSIQYTMYAINGTTIQKFSSADGINFQYERTVYGEMYNLTRPALLDSRIYFGIEFGEFGKIISINETGEYDSLKVEKGSPTDFENSISFNNQDVFFDPMVLNDYDKGVQIKRIVYRKDSELYAYENYEFGKTNLKEPALFTEYLEEYTWQQIGINNSYDVDYYSSTVYMENGNYYPIVTDKNGNKVNINSGAAYLPVGKLEILFPTEQEPLKIKVPFFQESIFEETESEGEWLDFYNVGETSATLTPEVLLEDYDPDLYTTELFISEKGFSDAYSKWLADNHPNPEPGKEELYRVEFLLNIKQYSVYLKWSKKGPGVYNYLSSVKRTAYTGDGSNV